LATVPGETLRHLPGQISRPPSLTFGSDGSREERKDLHGNGTREVGSLHSTTQPSKEGLNRMKRGGKAATVSQSAEQLNLPFDIADNPTGDVSALEMDLSNSSARAVPKPETKEPNLPSMTLGVFRSAATRPESTYGSLRIS